MTNYFSYFPTDYYQRNGNSVEITDITKRFVLIEYLKTIPEIFYHYRIENNERVDQVSYKIYGDYNLDWLILLVNGIFDSVFEWAMDYELFTEYLTAKYGSVEASTQQIDHYEYIYQKSGLTPEGEIIKEKAYNVDVTFYNQLIATQRRIVTCYDQESRLNDARREILLIRPTHIPQVLDEVKNIFQQQVK
jgi:hypothetical protein